VPVIVTSINSYRERGEVRPTLPRQAFRGEIAPRVDRPNRLKSNEPGEALPRKALLQILNQSFEQQKFFIRASNRSRRD